MIFFILLNCPKQYRYIREQMRSGRKIMGIDLDLASQ